MYNDDGSGGGGAAAGDDDDDDDNDDYDGGGAGDVDDDDDDDNDDDDDDDDDDSDGGGGGRGEEMAKVRRLMRIKIMMTSRGITRRLTMTMTGCLFIALASSQRSQGNFPSSPVMLKLSSYWLYQLLVFPFFFQM